MREAVPHLEMGEENLWSWRIRLGCEFQNNKSEILSTGLELPQAFLFQMDFDQEYFFEDKCGISVLNN